MSNPEKVKRVNRGRTNDRILAIETEQKTMNGTLNDINVNIAILSKDLKYNNETLSKGVIDNKSEIAHVYKIAKDTAIKVDRKNSEKEGAKKLIIKVTKIVAWILASMSGVYAFLTKTNII